MRNDVVKHAAPTITGGENIIMEKIEGITKDII